MVAMDELPARGRSSVQQVSAGERILIVDFQAASRLPTGDHFRALHTDHKREVIHAGGAGGCS
jgi:hypothetical protein